MVVLIFFYLARHVQGQASENWIFFKKRMKIEFFLKKEWKLRPESKKTNKFLPTFPFELFFIMFTPRAMFFFPMLDKSSGNIVAPKTANFKSI